MNCTCSSQFQLLRTTCALSSPQKDVVGWFCFFNCDNNILQGNTGLNLVSLLEPTCAVYRVFQRIKTTVISCSRAGDEAECGSIFERVDEAAKIRVSQGDEAQQRCQTDQHLRLMSCDHSSTGLIVHQRNSIGARMATNTFSRFIQNFLLWQCF